MPVYKLNYFDGRGAAEVIRQIFAAADVAYTDNRVKHGDWPSIKPTSPAPFGQMPFLEVDGQVLAQSHAIARFVAKRHGLNGKTDLEEAKVNEIADQFKDYQSEIRPYFIVYAGFAPGDKDQLFKEVFVPAFEKHFGFFKNILAKNGTGFLVGDGLTWVDLLLAQHISDLSLYKSNFADGYPELKAFSQKIQSIPAIKKWVETRPVTPF